MVNKNIYQELVRATRLPISFVKFYFYFGTFDFYFQNDFVCFSEAVEHFLQALTMQKRGEGPRGEKSVMSDNIWSTLRMTLSLMGRSELYELCERRDLEALSTQIHLV